MTWGGGYEFYQGVCLNEIMQIVCHEVYEVVFVLCKLFVFKLRQA